MRSKADEARRRQSTWQANKEDTKRAQENTEPLEYMKM